MRHAPTPTTARIAATGTGTGATGGFSWNSPLPYLFGGLASMLVLIAVALVILACSSRKSSGAGGNDGNGDEEKSSSGSVSKKAVDNELRFAVIMAGDFNPTFLAKPVPLPPPVSAPPAGYSTDVVEAGGAVSATASREEA